MLTSDNYRDPSAKGRKRPNGISRISNIHIHSGCHFTEQKLKVKKIKSFHIWTDFCVVAEILFTEKKDHCVGDWDYSSFTVVNDGQKLEY